MCSIIKSLISDSPMNDRPKTSGRRFLGDILVESGVISEDHLEQALDINERTGKRVGQILIDMGAATDMQIALALSDQLSVPLIQISNINIPADVLRTVPPEIVKKCLVIPIDKTDSTVTLAMANPLDHYAIDDVRFAAQLRVDVVIAMEQEVIAAIDKYYPDADLLRPLAEMGGEEEDMVVLPAARSEDTEELSEDDLLILSDQPPIVRFTNAILSDAIANKASDIHIEPGQKSVLVRYRIDGVMREIMKAERHIHDRIVTRVKVLSNMDITIRRMPQDGKFQVRFSGTSIDIRVSTLPTAYGEKLVMRVLNPMGAPESIDSLDLTEQQLADLRVSIAQPQGIVLITGPTGSGKTTTLYTCLKTVMSPEINIITLENPIEYELFGANQVEINPKQGLTFASGLRSILRQDPDIVLLGEIRDEETATVAFRAAQTGHLIFSTLHTRSALDTIPRLLDLGISPSQLTSTVSAIISQRLVRRLCNDCKEAVPLDEATRATLPAKYNADESVTAWRAEGCERCHSTGYAGRLAICEVLRITPFIEELLQQRKTAEETKKAVFGQGFITMAEDGIAKALDGLTTLSEVYRVAPMVSGGEESDSEKSGSSDEDTMAVEEIIGELQTPTIESVRPLRILVVDDQDFSFNLFQGILEGEGFTVIRAKTGIDAMNLTQKEVPDLIITAQVMPEMDGFTLIRKMRANLATAYIPTILITGEDSLDTEIESLNSGADDYLVKPINARKLIARVNRLLKRSHFN